MYVVLKWYLLAYVVVFVGIARFLRCACFGGFFVGHDTMCAEFADLAGGSEGIPGVVADWKAQVDAWPRSTRGYEADVGLYHLPGARDLYLDGVISLANPESYPG